MIIDRCVCFNQSFVRLKEVACTSGCATLESLQEQVRFGEKCMICHPYVRRMLETGETEFNEILITPPITPNHT